MNPIKKLAMWVLRDEIQTEQRYTRHLRGKLAAARTHLGNARADAVLLRDQVCRANHKAKALQNTLASHAGPEGTGKLPLADVLGETISRAGTVRHEALSVRRVHFPAAGLSFATSPEDGAVDVYRKGTDRRVATIRSDKIELNPVRSSRADLSAVVPTLTLP